jgi:hypothetical protein
MAINITDLTNITGLYDMASYVNTQSSGLLFGMLLPVIQVILLLSLRHQGIASLALSFLFIGLGLVHFTLIIAYVIMTLLGAFWLWYERNQE